MKKRIVSVSRKRTGLINIINQNNSLILIFFCFLLGLLIGVLYFKFKNVQGGYYSSDFNKLYNQLSGGSWQILYHSFMRLLPFAAAVFLSGTCMVGSVLVPAVVMVNGGTWGLVMGFAYSNHGLMGIVFNLLILIPPAVLSTVALILSARESLGFSLSLARLAVPALKPPEIEQDFKLYCLRQMFVFLFFCISSLVQSIMAMSFISFFNFK